jgi:membrane associated rhomboid family serine protease
VGHQCVDCVGEVRRTGRRATTVAGAEPGARPVVVPILIAVNVVVFALTAVQAGSGQRNDVSALFEAWELVPGLVTAGEWWRILTSGFLHFGLIHLAFNMLALWILGRDVETVLGRGRFLAVYLISMLGGSAAIMLIYGAGATVAGASGAVFGVMGALVVVLRRLRMPPGPALGIIAINVAIGFLIPAISLTAHVGGLLAGAAATVALVYAPARNRTTAQAAALGALTLVVLALIAVGAFVL